MRPAPPNKALQSDARALAGKERHLNRMRKEAPAANPDAYVRALDGWRKQRVEELRAIVHAVPGLEEKIKWGNLVYLANGPVAVIRAETGRVLFGFWRGRRLRSIEPRLKPGGKYEMATLDLKQQDTISSTTVRRLTTEAVALNFELGDPTLAAKRERTRRPTRR